MLIISYLTDFQWSRRSLWFRNINLKWNSSVSLLEIFTRNSPTFSVIFLCSDFKFPDDVKTFIIYLSGYTVSLPRSMLMTDVGDNFKMMVMDLWYRWYDSFLNSDDILTTNILKVIRKSATSLLPVSLKKRNCYHTLRSNWSDVMAYINLITRLFCVLPRNHSCSTLLKSIIHPNGPIDQFNRGQKCLLNGISRFYHW